MCVFVSVGERYLSVSVFRLCLDELSFFFLLSVTDIYSKSCTLLSIVLFGAKWFLNNKQVWIITANPERATARIFITG